MLFEVVALVTAFSVGFAMKRGGLCTYAAVVELVDEGRTRRMLSFLGAAAWAGLAVVPLAWLLPGHVMLSATHDVLAVAVLGGLLLGIGAFVNKGCFFGTFVQLVGGDLNYLATLLGLGGGVMAAHVWLAGARPATNAPALAAVPDMAGMLWLAATGLAAVTLLLRAVRGSGAAAAIMLTLGIGGGLLFATISGWDFASVLSQYSFRLLDAGLPSPSKLAILSTLGMVAGGIWAAVSAGVFRLRGLRLSTLVLCFSGGALMGGAAYLVPGGNDGMLLKGIPSLAPHALAGYLAMLTAMLALQWRVRAAVKRRGGSG